uniref:C2H2-type domain-containing protein n=1 Tax=Anopheles epiroticus TaxID=199890 RepID=A0A182PX08_9DIPT
MNVNKMTTAQKSAYLEAHMAVQQQMAQAAFQLQHHQHQLQQQHHSHSYTRTVKKPKINHDGHLFLHQGSLTQQSQQQHQEQCLIPPSALPNPTVSHYPSTIKVPQINAGSYTNEINASRDTVASAGTNTSSTNAASSTVTTTTGNASGNGSGGGSSGGCSSNSSGSSTFTVPDDVGMGFEGGVRVLQSLGNWYIVLSTTARLYLTTLSLLFLSHYALCFTHGFYHRMLLLGPRSPEIPPNIPRPNLIPFTEPYAEGGSMHPATRLKALQQVQQSSAAAVAAVAAAAVAVSGASHSKVPSAKGKTITAITNPTTTPKPVFECTVCGKGLARKDKLTIHMRIHTGEKPYVCEVCDRAFARRDKLVIHMNKFKHVTPTNIAPLGKRQNRSLTIEQEELKIEDNKPAIEVYHQALTPQTQTIVTNNIAAQPQQNQYEQQQQHQQQQKQLNNQLSHQYQQQVASNQRLQPALPDGTQLSGMSLQQSQHSLSWPCELCDRMFGSREDWTVHAKSHLE